MPDMIQASPTVHSQNGSSDANSHSNYEGDTLAPEVRFPYGRLAKTTIRQLPVTGWQMLRKCLGAGDKPLKWWQVIAVIPTTAACITAFPVTLSMCFLKGIQDYLFFPGQRRFNNVRPERQLLRHYCEFEESVRQRSPEEITVRPGNLYPLTGWYFKADNPAGLLLFLHGNEDTAIGNANNNAERFMNVGLSSLFCEYPGYGGSADAIYSEQDVFKAADAFFDAISATVDPYLPIYVLGSSIGTGIAAYLAASKERVTKAVLHAPYVSLKSLSRTYCRFLPKCLIKYDINTYQYLERFFEKPDTRALLIHAVGDNIIPYTQSAKLAAGFDAARICLQKAGGELSCFYGHCELSEANYDFMINAFLLDNIEDSDTDSDSGGFRPHSLVFESTV